MTHSETSEGNPILDSMGISKASQDLMSAEERDRAIKYPEKMPRDSHDLTRHDLRVLALEDVLPIDDLGQGERDNFFYYGFSGVSDGELVNAIIASGTDGLKIVVGDDEIKKLGVNFRIGIDSYAFGKYCLQPSEWRTLWFSKNREKHAAGELLKRLIETNRRYIWHRDDREHVLFACALMASYCYSLFSSFPRISLCGESGSGKTSQACMYELLGHNAFNASKASEAVFNRIKGQGVGLIIVNNFDDLPEEALKNFQRDFELSFERGIWSRAGETHLNKIEHSSTLKPYVIDSIAGVDWSEASRNRTIESTMETKPRGAKCDNVQLVRQMAELPPEFKALRQDLAFFVLDNWTAIKEAYSRVRGSAPLDSRALDVWAPVLTLAEMAGGDYSKQMLVLAAEKMQRQKQQTNPVKNYGYWALRYACEHAKKGEKLPSVCVRDVAEEYVREIHGLDVMDAKFKTKLPWESRSIASAMARLPMFGEGPKTGGVKHFVVNLEELKNYLQKRDEIELLGILQKKMEGEENA